MMNLQRKRRRRRLFILRRRFQGRLGDINIGFSELDDAARTVKLEEAKKRVRTLLVNNPYLTKEDVEDQLDEEGIRSIDVRFQNLNPKESYKIKINEIIAIVKELGHSHLKWSGLGSIYTSSQARFVYRLANDTPLIKKRQKGYNKLKSNGIDFSIYNRKQSSVKLYLRAVKDDAKYDVLHPDFYMSSSENKEDSFEEYINSSDDDSSTSSSDDDSSTSSSDDDSSTIGKSSRDDNSTSSSSSSGTGSSSDEYNNTNKKRAFKFSVFNKENDLFGTVGNPFKRTVYACFNYFLRDKQDLVYKTRIFYEKKYDKDPTDILFELTSIKFKETISDNDFRNSVIYQEIRDISSKFPCTELYKLLYKQAGVQFPLQGKDIKSFKRLCDRTYGWCAYQYPHAKAVQRLRHSFKRFRSKGGLSSERSLKGLGFNNMNKEHKDLLIGLMNSAISDCKSTTKQDKEFDHGFAISRYGMLMTFAKTNEHRSKIASDSNFALKTTFRVDKNIFFLTWSMNAVKSNKLIFNIVINFDKSDIDNIIFKFRCKDGVYRTLGELMVKYTTNQLLTLHSKDPVLTQYWDCKIAEESLLSIDEETAEATHRHIVLGIGHYTNYEDFVKNRKQHVMNKLRRIKRQPEFDDDWIQKDDFTIKKRRRSSSNDGADEYRRRMEEHISRRRYGYGNSSENLL